ncbi:MAG TPA: hypothetical protein VGL53_30465 [Bryobacteraceae bacterium]
MLRIVYKRRALTSKLFRIAVVVQHVLWQRRTGDRDMHDRDIGRIEPHDRPSLGFEVCTAHAEAWMQACAATGQVGVQRELPPPEPQTPRDGDPIAAARWRAEASRLHETEVQVRAALASAIKPPQHLQSGSLVRSLGTNVPAVDRKREQALRIHIERIRHGAGDVKHVWAIIEVGPATLRVSAAEAAALCARCKRFNDVTDRYEPLYGTEGDPLHLVRVF